MRLSRGATLGPYQIVSLLGSGGMGEVYRARDTRLERTVAIKVLPGTQAQEPERRQRFEREARAISGLSHPHICAVYDVGQEEGHDFLVMEYLEGETLAERLRKGPLPTEQVMRYAVEIAVALSAAHRQGVVHRDLKPANVMLTRAGAKLLDFGLAKVQEPVAQPSDLSQLPTNPLHSSLTVEGTIMGTLHYMAPEQLEGRSVDARTDIFAFGAVLYEMASGKKAFAGMSQASIIGAILHTEPPPLSQLLSLTPPGLDRVVRKCLAKDPDQRWQTAQDLADELVWLAQGDTGPLAVPVRPRRRRLPWAWIAAAAAVAGVGFGFAAGLWRAPSAPRLPVRATVLLPEGHQLSPNGGALALSPDGRQLAFVAVGPDGKERLWVRPLQGLSAQALAGTEGARSPFWSPDSRRLAYFADGQLRRIEASGGASEVLCAAALGRGGTWNREGVIVFVPDVGGPVHRVMESGGPSRPITRLERTRGENSHRWPAFLADGRRFLYMAWRGAGLAMHDVLHRLARRRRAPADAARGLPGGLRSAQPSALPAPRQPAGPALRSGLAAAFGRALPGGGEGPARARAGQRRVLGLPVGRVGLPGRGRGGVQPARLGRPPGRAAGDGARRQRGLEPAPVGGRPAAGHHRRRSRGRRPGHPRARPSPPGGHAPHRGAGGGRVPRVVAGRRAPGLQLHPQRRGRRSLRHAGLVRRAGGAGPRVARAQGPDRLVARRPPPALPHHLADHRPGRVGPLAGRPQGRCPAAVGGRRVGGRVLARRGLDRLPLAGVRPRRDLRAPLPARGPRPAGLRAGGTDAEVARGRTRALLQRHGLAPHGGGAEAGDTPRGQRSPCALRGPDARPRPPAVRTSRRTARVSW